MKRYQRKPEIGSVSSDTMRPEDLIPEFCYQAQEYGNRKQAARARQIERASEKDGYFDEEGGEKAGWDLDELFDILDEIAGRFNMSFGASEGDGACYGFWPNLPQEDDYQVGDSAVYVDGKPVITYFYSTETWLDIETGAKSKHVGLLIRRRMARKGYWPNVYEVNDHGNVTCYRITSKGELKGLWACV